MEKYKIIPSLAQHNRYLGLNYFSPIILPNQFTYLFHFFKHLSHILSSPKIFCPFLMSFTMCSLIGFWYQPKKFSSKLTLSVWELKLSSQSLWDSLEICVRFQFSVLIIYFFTWFLSVWTFWRAFHHSYQFHFNDI